MFDLNDPINCIYLARNGQPTGRKYQPFELMSYIAYLNALTKTFEIKIDSKNLNFKHVDFNFLNNFECSIKRDQRNKFKKYSESTVLNLLSKIEKSNNILNLTDDEFDFLCCSVGISSIESVLSQFKLPNITQLNKRDDEYLNLIKESKKDKHFSQKIYAIYKVDSKHKPKKLKHVMRCVHGTSNLSLLSILDGGFKRPSELRGKDVKFSGQALGDGVYFARLDQMSKPQAYLDARNYNRRYMIVADIYYDTCQHTEHFQTFKYSGKNVVHAHKMGNFYRDEIVALPQQIDIKYIIELQ